jgi:predicted transcriptional regulator
MASEKVKMTLEMSSELNEAIEHMAEELSSSKSEVVRKALALMEIAFEAKGKDQSLALVRKKDDKLVTLIVGI